MMDRHGGLLSSEEMLTSAQVADICGVSLNTLQKWRSRNMGPRYIKFGGSNAATIRYKRSDVELFLSARTIKPFTERN